jgi:hypothetical protein
MFEIGKPQEIHPMPLQAKNETKVTKRGENSTHEMLTVPWHIAKTSSGFVLIGFAMRLTYRETQK